MHGKSTIAVSLCYGGIKERSTTAFVQLVEFIQPSDAVDDFPRCVCLCSAAAEGEEKETDVHRLKEETSHTTAEKWSGTISFERVLSTVHAVWATIAVHTLAIRLL